MKKAAALKYTYGQDEVPRVIASGRGYIAEKIIELAEQNNIPLFKNEGAAEVLCNLTVGSEIPDNLYQVIAEIYAYILRVESKKK